MTHAPDPGPPTDLERVAEVDTGGRRPTGVPAGVLSGVALAWSLFQLWYASPLPFVLRVGVLNDTEARSLHLGIALFLAYLAYPAWRRSPRARIPALDWALALAGAVAGGYLFWAYAQVAERPGQPSQLDVVTATAGLVLLLEATRRALGVPMTALALVMLGYAVLGAYLPDVISHKGASLPRLLSHMWLTTEGVYGIALGVSASYIFIFVLFGALLDRAGAGNYMMQVSFALLGHLRGGPAKVAVVSSGLNGLISGSSVSNVVSGGIFTIPLMKKAGYGGVKAGAIETASSVNGQIMPPVMGAAAFLMTEYVGIPYSDIVKHAFLPATISYIALFYIVHLEALKLGLEPVARRREATLGRRLLGWGLGLTGGVAAAGAVYVVATAVQGALGPAAPWVLAALLGAAYLGCLALASRQPDLPPEIDVDARELPETWPTVQSGLHFGIPVGVLIWCLMIEQLSPGLSAFWATATLIGLMLTQRPLMALLRGEGGLGAAVRQGIQEVVLGLHDGARGMIGIAVATATAGIIVGGITLTGLGLRMTEFVETVSGGHVGVMLLFTAFVCLVLGMGVPTTANYILVATLIAPVIVELGAQAGLIIPLIAVHLFVFYFGIMGDITPPVGLATFAAAAISGEDSIRTGLQGAVYALRTVVLPFVFVFNPMLLLIDVESWPELGLVVLAGTLASLLFGAATVGYFQAPNRWWEAGALLLAAFALFRPDYFVELIYPPFENRPPALAYDVAARLPEGGRVALVIRGTTIEGDEVTKTVAVRLGPAGPDGRARLAEAGLGIVTLGDRTQIGQIRFGSRARKSGFEPGWDVVAVKVRGPGPSPHWMYVPAVGLAGLVVWAQRRRLGAPGGAAPGHRRRRGAGRGRQPAA